MFLVPHHFFVDNKNQVQLVLPDYYSKSRKFEIINQIRKECKLEQNDYRAYKRINVQNFSDDDNKKVVVKRESSIQRMDDLRKILIHKGIDQNKILTFCKDGFDQVLYIYQADLPSIAII